MPKGRNASKNVFVLGASAKVWGSSRKTVGDLEEKGNWCVSAFLTETTSSSCYQKTTIEPKQLLPTPSQLQKVIADCYTSTECSWLSPTGVEGGGCPRASIKGRPWLLLPWPRCRARPPLCPPHKPAPRPLIFCFQCCPQSLWWKLLDLPPFLRADMAMLSHSKISVIIYTNSEGDSCHTFLNTKVLCCSLFQILLM